MMAWLNSPQTRADSVGHTLYQNTTESESHIKQIIKTSMHAHLGFHIKKIEKDIYDHLNTCFVIYYYLWILNKRSMEP